MVDQMATQNRGVPWRGSEKLRRGQLRVVCGTTPCSSTPLQPMQLAKGGENPYVHQPQACGEKWGGGQREPPHCLSVAFMLPFPLAPGHSGGVSQGGKVKG